MATNKLLVILLILSTILLTKAKPVDQVFAELVKDKKPEERKYIKIQWMNWNVQKTTQLLTMFLI